ncbi:GntR family transcriptional regulator [Nonomuraea typhae]|uniref:GntR family transcriptional regulator n=1 Tax=Nonomuraea typhae TaxID=2603600 RepID=A0ABW7YYN7_9ACTN
MPQSAARAEPVYLQIAAQIRARIVDGELRPGDQVPTTRRIMADWNVAMATASKVLSRLREDGLVHVVPGRGTVVSPRTTTPVKPAGPIGRGDTADEALTPAQVVATAVRIADSEGLTAVTMRRVAAELGTAAMSIYRHVPNKADLVRQMVDAVFSECVLPEPGPAAWHERLEIVARAYWQIYKRHPWATAPAIASPTQPRLIPSAMDHLEWELRGMAHLGLDHVTLLRAVISLHCYVGGIALGGALARESELDTGLSSEEQQRADVTATSGLFTSTRFPIIAELDLPDDSLTDLDGLFEFGLQRQLTGLVSYVADTTNRD